MVDVSHILAEQEEASEEIKPRPLSRLTYRILSFNLLVVLILAMGISYLGSTRKNLILNRLDNFENESYLYSVYLNEFLSNSPDLKSANFDSASFFLW